MSPRHGVQRCVRRLTLRTWCPAALWLAAIVLAVGCVSDVAPAASRLEPTFVTGAAAAALRKDGKFAMPDSVVDPPGQIRRAQAVAIARRYVVDIGPLLVGSWSKIFGSPLEVSDLAPCKNPLYAASPYVSMPNDLAEATTRLLDPHWVVPVCTGGHVAVVLSFSARDTDLAVPPPANPHYETADMLSVGVPADADASFYEPEAAALLAYTRTGRRVKAVPQLVMNPYPEVPQLIRWRIEMETPVRVVGSQSANTRLRDALLIGFGPLFRTSGLYDVDDARASGSITVFDAKRRGPVSVALSSLAPAPVERVTLEGQP